MTPQISHRPIYTLHGFLYWARNAVPGDKAIYHAGELVLDRRDDPDLDSVADTASVLEGTGWLRLTRNRRFFGPRDLWVYAALRAQGGYAPRGLLTGAITSYQWRAINAVKEREANVSAVRAIRNAVSSSLSTSDEKAEALFNELVANRWVEESEIKGWNVSSAGRRML